MRGAKNSVIPRQTISNLGVYLKMLLQQVQQQQSLFVHAQKLYSINLNTRKKKRKRAKPLRNS